MECVCYSIAASLQEEMAASKKTATDDGAAEEKKDEAAAAAPTKVAVALTAEEQHLAKLQAQVGITLVVESTVVLC